MDVDSLSVVLTALRYGVDAVPLMSPELTCKVRQDAAIIGGLPYGFPAYHVLPTDYGSLTG